MIALNLKGDILKVSGEYTLFGVSDKSVQIYKYLFKIYIWF